MTRDNGRVVADWALTARDLPPGGAPRDVVLPFELPDTAFDGELRVRSLGTSKIWTGIINSDWDTTYALTLAVRRSFNPLAQFQPAGESGQTLQASDDGRQVVKTQPIAPDWSAQKALHDRYAKLAIKH